PERTTTAVPTGAGRAPSRPPPAEHLRGSFARPTVAPTAARSPIGRDRAASNRDVGVPWSTTGGRRRVQRSDIPASDPPGGRHGVNTVVHVGDDAARGTMAPDVERPRGAGWRPSGFTCSRRGALFVGALRRGVVAALALG